MATKERTTRRGLMLVLSSPSGAGKTTMSRRLLNADENVVMSISVTTRAKRPNEVEGKDYFFVTPEKFAGMRDKGAFLEHAVVFGRQYGTPKKAVEDALATGRDVLFDIDWQGAKQLREHAHGDLVSVFILPPSKEDLARRLTTRAEDSAETVRARMAKADDEISHWQEYDYVIVNDDIQHAMGELEEILRVERRRRTRQPWLEEFVRGLVKKG